MNKSSDDPLRVSVARSARSDRKLWTGISSVSLLAALRLAAANGWALATAEARPGGGAVVVVEQHGGEGLTQVPFEVIGE